MKKTAAVICASLTTTFFLCASGCGKKADLVVANVGEKKITVGDLYQAGQKIAPEGEGEISDTQKLRKCLDLLINKELIVLEGKNRELYKDKKVFEALKEKKRGLMLRKLYEVEVENKTKVSDEQAREYFDQNRLNEKVRIGQLVVKTESAARQILTELEQGKNFAELARQKSTDKRSAQKGGDAGWFVRGGLIPEIEEIVFSMKVGQLSHPVKTRSGYSILKLADKKEVKFKQLKDEIKESLFPEAAIQKRREHSNSVRVENHLQYEAQGLIVFLNEQQELGQELPELSAEVGKTVLYRFDGGEMTLTDFVEDLKRLCRSCKYPAIGDSAAWKPIADRVVLEFVLLPRIARQLGIDGDKKIIAELERSKEAFVAERLREIEVLEQVYITEAQTREYFHTHRDDYIAPARTEVVDILLKAKKQAETTLQRLKQGADMEELAEKHSTLKRPGEFRWKFPMVNDKRSESIFGKRFVKAVFEAKLGEITGPIEVRNGYAVFKVLKREPPRRRSFGEVKNAVTTLLRQREEERLFNELMKNLREKYDPQIIIYEDTLRKVTTGETNVSAQS